MNNIRRNRRATRVPFIILTVVLSVGLVASFALWSSPQVLSRGSQAEHQQPVAPAAPAGSQQQAKQNEQASPEVEFNTKIQQYEAVLRSNPQNMPIWKSLGDTRYDLGLFYAVSNKQDEAARNWQKALEAYGKYLEKEPASVDVRVDRATVAFYSGQNDLAEKDFKQALADNPGHINGHLNYGVFLAEAKKDTQAALKEWQKVLELKPGADAEKKARDLISQYKGK